VNAYLDSLDKKQRAKLIDAAYEVYRKEGSEWIDQEGILGETERQAALPGRLLPSRPPGEAGGTVFSMKLSFLDVLRRGGTFRSHRNPLHFAPEASERHLRKQGGAPGA